MPPLTWSGLLIVLTAFAAAVWGWIKLFFEASIKEGVKSEFDLILENHKAALDEAKQNAIKTFGLFSEKNTRSMRRSIPRCAKPIRP
jgi:hypothetical protein